MLCLHVVCALCECSAHIGQKRALDPVVLELQRVVSHPVGCWDLDQRPIQLTNALTH